MITLSGIKFCCHYLTFPGQDQEQQPSSSDDPEKPQMTRTRAGRRNTLYVIAYQLHNKRKIDNLENRFSKILAENKGKQ